MLVSDRILNFFSRLDAPKLPRGIAVMNPYAVEKSMAVVKAFYDKYYSDNNPRTLMLGINPGRFGAGITGISFTDPIRLEKVCGIPNDFDKKPELSSDFIYRMIEASGGVTSFYNRFLISAMSPLGFTKDGKNINYYDDRKLEAAVVPFAKAWIQKLVNLGVDRSKCFCIGEGKNYVFLNKLNDEMRWFESVIPLPHPRFIMQYRRKQLHRYLRVYVEALSQ